MIDDMLLAEMKSRLDKATPGPWVSYVEGRDHESGSNFIMTGGEDIELTGLRMTIKISLRMLDRISGSCSRKWRAYEGSYDLELAMPYCLNAIFWFVGAGA